MSNNTQDVTSYENDEKYRIPHLCPTKEFNTDMFFKDTTLPANICSVCENSSTAYSNSEALDSLLGVRVRGETFEEDELEESLIKSQTSLQVDNSMKNNMS